MIGFRKWLLLMVLASTLTTIKAADFAILKNYSGLGEISTLKVFLQGPNIDFDYIRRNIKFVDFVNDPLGSDVHVIITQNSTGSGGTNFVLNFYSKTIDQIGDITLNCVTLPGDPGDAVRECILKTLKMGLVPYVNETQDGKHLQIVYSNPNGDKKESVTASIDPWKKWVFKLNTNGGFSLEQSIKNYNYSFNVRADKISDQIKFKNSFYIQNKFKEVINEGVPLVSQNNYIWANSENVYSLSERWSSGVFLSFFQSSFWNTKYSYEIKPALEYNFFPWEVADKRVFTIAYFAGIDMKSYFQTTIFGKESENLWEQNLKLNFELIQPWGEIETRLEGSTYLHDLTKNSLTFESGLSLRITRGLSLNFGFRAENIHNQLYLPAQEVSLEDILLGKSKLPSTFDVSGNMGIRIQFGSLYNNVVNNRL